MATEAASYLDNGMKYLQQVEILVGRKQDTFFPIICLRWRPPLSTDLLMVRSASSGASDMALETTSLDTMRRAKLSRLWLMVLTSSGPYTISSPARPVQHSLLVKHFAHPDKNVLKGCICSLPFLLEKSSTLEDRSCEHALEYAIPQNAAHPHRNTCIFADKANYPVQRYGRSHR